MAVDGIHYSENSHGPVLAECLVRPLAFYGDDQARDGPTDFVLVSWPRDELGGGLRYGVCLTGAPGGVELRSMIAVPGDGTIPRALASDGGRAILVVRDGAIATPDPATSILPGRSREAVLELARGLGFAVIERPLCRADIDRADELLVARAGGELIRLAAAGPVSRRLEQAQRHRTGERGLRGQVRPGRRRPGSSRTPSAPAPGRQPPGS